MVISVALAIKLNNLIIHICIFMTIHIFQIIFTAFLKKQKNYMVLYCIVLYTLFLYHGICCNTFT